MISAKNDTFEPELTNISRPIKADNMKSETVYMFRESTKPTIAENQHHDFIMQQQLKVKEDQINRLLNQINAFQHSTLKRARHSFVFCERTQQQTCNIQHKIQKSEQLLQAQNNTIQILINRLRSLQLQPEAKETF